MPLITGNLIENMLLNSKWGKINLLVHDDFTEPLFGIYPKKFLPFLNQSIHQNQFKIIDIVKKYGFNPLNINDSDQSNKNTNFTNINTSADLKKIEKNNNLQKQ